ncbi:ankyrin repeat-containing domain protein [Stachybotrys elegans]|uniref:Ankyrin repeat-containing domain protein n=1 Tax=Stachybotrys elegans TaxID=80388 RepID=A0A8K0SU99_9HYPO|nr:ankyrin repeat-containing domain protein [Stachybotrys elegans]
MEQFPNEIILEMGKWLEKDTDLNSLSRACKTFSVVLDPLLYTRSLVQFDAIEYPNHRIKALPKTALWKTAFGGTRESFIKCMRLDNTRPRRKRGKLCNELFWHLCRDGNLERVKLLLEHYEEVDINCLAKDHIPLTSSALYVVIERGHLDVARFLLEHPAINCSIRVQLAGQLLPRTPLCPAISRGEVELVRLMLANRTCDPSPKPGDCRSMLMFAINKWSAFRIEAFKGNKDMTEEISSQNPFAEITRMLLDTGRAGINHRSSDGWTALEMAIGDKNVIAFEWLINTPGVDIDVNVNRDHHPALLASQRGCARMMELLIEKNAEINIIDSTGWQTLHVASMTGSVGVVTALLKSDRLDRSYRNQGDSALHYAISYGNKGVVWVLIRAGWSVDEPDRFGITGLQHARNSKVPGMKELVQSRAAGIPPTVDGESPLKHLPVMIWDHILWG